MPFNTRLLDLAPILVTLLLRNALIIRQAFGRPRTGLILAVPRHFTCQQRHFSCCDTGTFMPC